MYVPQDSWITWPYIFALNFDDWLLCPTNLCSPSAPISLCIFNYNNQRSSIISSNFSGGMYISIKMLLGSGNVLIFLGLREYFFGAAFVFFFCFLILNCIISFFWCFLDHCLEDSIKGIAYQLFYCVKKLAFVYTYYLLAMFFSHAILQRIKIHNLWHIFDLCAQLNIFLYNLIINHKSLLSSILRDLEF